jgi:hypothetical protein
MTDYKLRAQLIRLLEADDAHMRFEEAVADFPDNAINERPPNVGYTPWHLVEHLRITQWDIVEYVRNPAWVSPDWPIGYWPDPAATATPAEFAASVERFLADRAAGRHRRRPQRVPRRRVRGPAPGDGHLARRPRPLTRTRQPSDSRFRRASVIGSAMPPNR